MSLRKPAGSVSQPSSGKPGKANAAGKPEKKERPSYAIGRELREKRENTPPPLAPPSGAERLRSMSAEVDPLTGIPKTDHGRVDVRQIVESLLADLSRRRAAGLYARVGPGIRQIWDDVEAEARGGMVGEDIIDHLQRLMRILDEQEEKLDAESV